MRRWGTFDEVSTNANSGYGSLVSPMTPYQLAVTQKSVEQVYDVFISHVAEGRGMTKAQVDSIGQGRVWSGIDAKQIGLVDLFGNLTDAIKLAASLAKLDEYRVVDYPTQKDPFEEILSSFGKRVLWWMSWQINSSSWGCGKAFHLRRKEIVFKLECPWI
jgi:protease-4